MRVVGYIRVSTDRQADEGLGPDVQEREIRKWAGVHRHQIVELCRDEGKGGSQGLESRIGLGQAMENLRERTATGLVVFRLDRLARDMVLQEQLLAGIWQLGAEAFSTSPSEGSYLSEDPDDPSRKLIRQVLGAVAEYERGMISLRLRLGRVRKAEKGGYAYGSPPFGYRAEGKALIEDSQEAKAMYRMTELRRNGRSLHAICSELQQEGLGAKRGGRWHPTTVARVLRRVGVS